MEVMEKKDPKKKRGQSAIDRLTARERMDMEKCLNWLFRVYQDEIQKKDGGEVEGLKKPKSR